MIKQLQLVRQRATRCLLVALLGLTLAPGCGQEPAGIVAVVETGHSPPRPSYCPAAGPCLEREQEPILLRADTDHRLILRGWGLRPVAMVEIGGHALSASVRADGSLGVKVKKATVKADTTLVVRDGVQGSPAVKVVVTPAISQVDAFLYKGGSLGVLVHGTGFGDTAGAVEVTAGGTGTAWIDSWSNTQVQFALPDWAVGHEVAFAVVRRLIVDGEDRGPLRGVGFSWTVNPYILSTDCTKPRNESCAISGFGFGAKYTVRVNGVPISKGTFTPTKATFPLPQTVKPGPLQIQLERELGAKSNIAHGELLAWSKLRHRRVRFPATPGSYVRVAGTWWLLVHEPKGAYNALTPYNEKGPGLARCVLKSDVDLPDEAPNYMTATADKRVWLLGGPKSGFPNKDASIYWCSPAGEKPGEEAKLAAHLDTDLVDPPLLGIAAHKTTVYALLGDTTTKQARLYGMDTKATTMTTTFVHTVAGTGRLVGGGGQVYLVRDPDSSAPFMRLVGGKLVAISNPWINTLKAAPPARVSAKGELQLVVALADGSTAIRSYDPAKSSWKDVLKVPAKVGVVSSALQHFGAWWVLGRTANGAGGDSLHAWKSADGKLWRRLYEDLTVVGKCAATVGPGLMMSSAKDLPAVAWELKAPGCVDGAVNTHLGEVGLATRELLEK